MNKFKFGDRVHVAYPYWSNANDVGVVIGSNGGLNNVQFEKGGYSGLVPDKYLTLASDWVKCSERMPDIDVEVLVYFDGYIYIDSLYYDKNLKEYWWQGNDRLPTHWMPLPNKL